MLLVLLALSGAALAVYIWRAFPAVDGELRAQGLRAQVAISRDAADIPHIEAASSHDAWFALGHLHAQERGWQLEFNRRVMRGELSEILGEATLDTDRLLRTLGIARAAQRQWEALPAEGREAAQAYSDGVNAFYRGASQALPPEFHILGVKPGGRSGQPWSPQDSVGWLMMMALDLSGNWGSEFARLSAAQKLDTAALWQLFPPYPGELPASRTDFSKLYAGLGLFRGTGRAAPLTPAVPQAGGKTRLSAASASAGPGSAQGGLRQALAESVNAWAGDLGNNEGKGSNSWVVAGSHTQSGKPLLANDPHLGLTAPAVWYFARLKAAAAPGENRPPLDVMGATLPGLPFVVLGRTRHAAWTFTNTAPDVQDLYIEQINPDNPLQYRVPASGSLPAWADFATRQETIRVKDRPDVTLTVRETRHGPVLSDVQKSHGELIDTRRHVLALRFPALDADNQTFLAGLRVNRSQTVGDMLEAFAGYHSPMQSVVMADSTGQTAFKAVGKVPLRRGDNDIKGIAPSPGWDARYDWSGWLAYSQTPQAGHAQIGRTGWLSTANQRITPPGYPYFIGQDWTVPYRQDRIVKLLAQTPKHSMETMKTLQGDVHSEAALVLWPYLRQSAAQSRHPLAQGVRETLSGFSGDMNAGDAAPLVLSAWVQELTIGVVGGRLGDGLFRSLYGKRHFRSAVEGIMARNDSRWCGEAGCAAQSDAALGRALDRLQALYGNKPGGWRWGKAHAAVSAHRPFSSVPALARVFDVRAPTGGDTFTVNVGQYWDSGDGRPFANRHAASMRAIYDLANLEDSLFIYQTGQSGLVFSGRYRDMASEWSQMQYRPLKMEPPLFLHRLTLLP